MELKVQTKWYVRATKQVSQSNVKHFISIIGHNWKYQIPNDKR